MARRYHWHSTTVKDFVAAPHTGIVGAHQGMIMNLVDAHARPAQGAMLEIARDYPENTLREVGSLGILPAFSGNRHLRMPVHHDVRATDVDLKRLGAVLAVAYERELHDFAELLLVEKLGPRTLQSLALVAEMVHGTPTRFSDPARFSFALGGKDGHPFPVPLKTYDETIHVLRRSLEAAKIGNTDKIDGLRRLDRFVQAIEHSKAPRADFRETVAREREISSSLDGTTAGSRPVRSKPGTKQLSLF